MLTETSHDPSGLSTEQKSTIDWCLSRVLLSHDPMGDETAKLILYNLVAGWLNAAKLPSTTCAACDGTGRVAVTTPIVTTI